jgi:excisionase family DNA binding protein
VKNSKTTEIAGIAQPATSREALMTRYEACKYLSISLRKFDSLVSTGEIPKIRFGRRCIRFAPSDLDAYVDKQRA